MLLLIALSGCRNKDWSIEDSSIFEPVVEDTGPFDLDGDGLNAADDCDDNDADVGEPGSWYQDADADGYGAGAVWTSCQAPDGYVEADGDCDDTDAAYHPGAEESDCTDPADYNCDGSVGYADADGDGFAACEECDDTDGAIHPDADEVCNGVDDDCDGSVDVGASDASSWYADTDGDGYGDADVLVTGCEAPSGYVADATDCDDADASFTDGTTWYADDDADGYGDPDDTAWACEAPEGHLAEAGDCDDQDDDIHPDATEVCNDEDDDCDGTIDQGAEDASTWYADTDGDGYGDADSTSDACDAPSGHVADDTDCDDTDASVGDSITWYADTDGDGYGDASNTVGACTAPSGYGADDTDCDDTDADVSPAGSEVCNEVDDDCNGTVDDGASDATWWYEDADCDGYGDSSTGVQQCDTPGDDWIADDTDCDDSDSLSNPGAVEVCLSVDNDCDGTVDNDCTDTTEIDAPSHDPVDSPSTGAACALIGEMTTSMDAHDSSNLSSFMAILDGTSTGLEDSTETDSVELDWSNRCGTDYAASEGNYTSSTNSWPTLSATGSRGAGRFRGYLNLTCDDDLNKTIGLMGNDSLSLSIEGAEIVTVNWNDGQWKKFRYITFPEPGLYAFEVQWSTNLNCAIDPFELVWADGFVSGYEDYDDMCDYSSCDVATGTAIPGFAIIEGDELVQATDGAATDCVQCASTSDCGTGETCNNAGICE